MTKWIVAFNTNNGATLFWVHYLKCSEKYIGSKWKISILDWIRITTIHFKWHFWSKHLMRPPLTPHFEAQNFSAAATPLRDVSKISAGPPLHKSWIRTCDVVNFLVTTSLMWKFLILTLWKFWKYWGYDLKTNISLVIYLLAREILRDWVVLCYFVEYVYDTSLRRGLGYSLK